MEPNHIVFIKIFYKMHVAQQCNFLQGVSFKTQPLKDAHASSTGVGKVNKPGSQCVPGTLKEVA